MRTLPLAAQAAQQLPLSDDSCWPALAGSLAPAYTLNMATAPASIDAYIAELSPQARKILEKIRQIVRRAAPEAEEVISYRMPAFQWHGILLYVAAFRKHIGLYPPIRGDARLEKALARYAGPKGNLRFPLDEPMPFELIERIAKLRVKQNGEKAAKKKTAKKTR